MATPDIIIRVGAAADRSIDSVFDYAEKRGQRAFEAVRKGASRSAQSQEKEQVQAKQLSAAQQLAIEKWKANQELKVQRDVYRENSRLNRQMALERMKAEREASTASTKLARERTRERMRAISEEERAEQQYQRRLLSMRLNSQREANRAQRAQDREKIREAYRTEREIDRFATRTSHRATRFFFPRPEGALGYGRRIAGDLMRGAGVDMTLSGGVTRARERETAGMGLAQQERIATGGTSIGGAAWAEFTRGTGEALKVDPEQVTAMVRAFTGKTGEFATARDLTKELGEMAIASGADLAEMGNAAGFVFNQLKGLDGAGQMTIDVLRGIIGQTAVGSVEMEDYAVQMGRIAANAQKFKGNTGENIRKLSALAQLAVASGGATGAADAARSVGAFVNTFGKEARISAFAKHGVDLFEDQTNTLGPRGKIKSHGTIMRDPFEIIKDAIFKTQGDIPTLANMFADTLGRKPVTALANAWSKAGGGGRGSAGEKAIDREIAQYMSASMSRETQASNIAAYNQTIAARTQEFQNKLDQITTSLASKLLPTLESMAPKLLKITDAFAGIVAWAAENPWKAVMAALTASIARAGFESLGRLALERIITGFAGNAAGNAVGGVAGSAAGGLLGKAGGAIGGALTSGGMAGAGGLGVAANAAGVLALGAATFMITNAIIESASTTVQQSAEQRARSSNDTFQVFAKEYMEAKTADEREAAVKRAKANVNEIEGNRGFFDRLFGSADIYLDTMKAIDAFVKQESDKRIGGDMANAKEAQANTEAAMAAALKQTFAGAPISVHLTNPDDIKFPGLDGGGTAPASMPVVSQGSH